MQPSIKQHRSSFSPFHQLNVNRLIPSFVKRKIVYKNETKMNESHDKARKRKRASEKEKEINWNRSDNLLRFCINDAESKWWYRIASNEWVNVLDRWMSVDSVTMIANQLVASDVRSAKCKNYYDYHLREWDMSQTRQTSVQTWQNKTKIKKEEEDGEENIIILSLFIVWSLFRLQFCPSLAFLSSWDRQSISSNIIDVFLFRTRESRFEFVDCSHWLRWGSCLHDNRWNIEFLYKIKTDDRIESNGIVAFVDIARWQLLLFSLVVCRFFWLLSRALNRSRSCDLVM